MTQLEEVVDKETIETKISFEKHTKAELETLARDIVDGKVFASWMIANMRLNPGKIGFTFAPVRMAYSIKHAPGEQEELDWNKKKKFILKRFKEGYPEADDVRHFYEYMDKAVEKNHRGSGMPMFATCRALDVDECIKLNALMDKIKK